MKIFYRRQPGDEANQLYERYRDALNEELEGVMQTTPRDADQDRVIEEDERISGTTIGLIRS
jgi:hypothetical protein